MSDSSYVCPNGHDFPAIVAVPCGECNATVACEPASRGMALDVEVERLRAVAAELYEAAHAAAACLVDARDAVDFMPGKVEAAVDANVHAVGLAMAHYKSLGIRGTG